ncbi:putative arsenate reductase (Arc2) [Aspergillus stella-maris]|uniref:putative arsenate reductase (Arc2) n=1 Tax=Aspergillus stella-maris TaxID=1810926 RepID=UPI003CCD8FE3
MATEQPWHASFPAPTSDPDALPAQTVLSWLQDGTECRKSGVNFLLVDLRRTDHEGGTIKGSLNLPAQSLYYTLPTLYTLVTSAGVKDVAFYCGSSAGRGTRAAAWFADYIKEQGGEDKVKSWKLEGGIKGWVKGGEEFTKYMDGFDKAHWEK